MKRGLPLKLVDGNPVCEKINYLAESCGKFNPKKLNTISKDLTLLTFTGSLSTLIG